MKVRTAVEADRERVLTSFSPMFGSWDYLPQVVNYMLCNSPRSFSLLAEDEDLVVMAHAYETEPGIWFLRGLRSNPAAGSFRKAIALIACCREMNARLIDMGADRVRFSTLDSFRQSLRLADILGFREEFRLWQSKHPLPDVQPDSTSPVSDVPFSDSLLPLFLSGSSIAEGSYYFTWWDTRCLNTGVLRKAADEKLILAVDRGGSRTGIALMHNVHWHGIMVLSLLDGDDESLLYLYRSACSKASEMGCSSIGLVHPSREEALRRQELFGLSTDGSFTVQMSRETQGLCGFS